MSENRNFFKKACNELVKRYDNDTTIMVTVAVWTFIIGVAAINNFDLKKTKDSIADSIQTLPLEEVNNDPANSKNWEEFNEPIRE